MWQMTNVQYLYILYVSALKRQHLFQIFFPLFTLKKKLRLPIAVPRMHESAPSDCDQDRQLRTGIVCNKAHMGFSGCICMCILIITLLIWHAGAIICILYKTTPLSGTKHRAFAHFSAHLNLQCDHLFLFGLSHKQPERERERDREGEE